VNNLHFDILRRNVAGTIAQVHIFVGGNQVSSVDVVMGGNGLNQNNVVATGVDLTGYRNVTRIEIIDAQDNIPLYLGDFRFSPAIELDLVAHRTGGRLGEAIPEDVENENDPANFVILVNDDYEEMLVDGSADFTNSTAAIPYEGSPFAPDDDLVKITLHKLPEGLHAGTVAIHLSNDQAVQLFKADGSHLWKWGDSTDVLYLDLANPTGYLAGLLTGDVNIWLEGLIPDPHFAFSYAYGSPSTALAVSDEVHFAIADWSFRGYDGAPLNEVEPIWEQALLAALQEATSLGSQGQVSDIPEGYFYKNAIVGLPGGIQVQLQVTSDDDPSETYIDDLMQVSDRFISRYFAALYGSEEILDADPDLKLTPSQRQEILSVLGLNVVHNQGQTSTLTTGPADNPTDSHTRRMGLLNPVKISFNSDVVNAGGQISGTISDPTAPAGYLYYVRTSDGQEMRGTVQGNAGLSVTFNFNATAPGDIVLKASVYPNVPSQTSLSVGFLKQNSALVRVLPAGQVMPAWTKKAWDALKVNGVVPGDPINRNRKVT
jgi:hypothetical protein